MLFPKHVADRFEFHRADMVPADEEVDDSGDEAESQTGGADAPDRATAGNQNAQNAQRRIDREKAELRQRIANQDARNQRLEQELNGIKPKLSQLDKLLSALAPAGAPEPLENLDTLDQDQMRGLLRDILSRQDRTETTVSTIQAGQQVRSEPSAREIIANERTAQSEIDFARERGLSVGKVRDANGQSVEAWVSDTDEEGAWAPEKMDQFIGFMRSSGRRGSGKHGEFTIEDFEEAEFRFDRDGVRNRDRKAGQRDVLDPRGDSNGRRGERTSSPATNGVIPTVRAIAELQKGKNPFKDANDMLGCLLPRLLGSDLKVSAGDTRTIKTLLREKFPEFLHDVEHEVAASLGSPAKEGAFDE